MANYESVTRSNYFHVKDEDAFSKFMDTVSGDDMHCWSDKDEDGNTLHAFGSAGVPLMDISAGWMTMAYLMTFQESVIRNVIFIFRSGISRKGLLISSISHTRLLMPQKNTLRLQSKRSAGTLLQILKTKEKNYDLKSKIQIQQTYRHK